MTTFQNQKQRKLLEKATCLLELINKAHLRRQSIEEDLSLYRKAGPYDNIRLFSNENDFLIKIARMNDIEKRLLKSYKWLIVDLYMIVEDYLLPINFIRF